ncbi:hypothetical protein ACF06D_16580 [Streptomyces griseoluteus]|uniref:hypothetical protein n=1 Tax=Streptomyces griseoluteus TaxID=29306 RepID=UPI0036FBD966
MADVGLVMALGLIEFLPGLAVRLGQCCALSGGGLPERGGRQERRRPRAASARGPPKAGRLDPVKKL